jgi:hypothetical protein|nr:MAG TPA: Putative amidoligase enzyme [Caudoviricetes sp.]
MQVIDEITGRKISRQNCALVAVQHLPGTLVLGYSSRSESIIRFLAYVEGELRYFEGDKELLKDVLVYSVYRGCYVSVVDFPSNLLPIEQYQMGFGSFPYHFERRYEAVESFNIFEGKQQIVHPETFKVAEHLKYSFGLEFETSMGYVPEDLCFRDGLIPLRDGSISGLEYSTVVMEGNSGLSLLRQQLGTLRKYTAFNKECSLHMHFGGFNLEPKSLYRAYLLCKGLESEIGGLVPPETFHSAHYKANGKDYCMKLPSFKDFDQLYEYLVGRRFYGSLTQPHPNDIRREAKWRIPTRYYWVNFVNAVCYNVNKTIEFRLLRPTYNFEKVLTWISIFNAILAFAEKEQNLRCYRGICLEHVITTVYPEDVSKQVMEGVRKLQVLTINQIHNGDDIGRDVVLENSLFHLE